MGCIQEYDRWYSFLKIIIQALSKLGFCRFIFQRQEINKNNGLIV